MRPQGFLDAQYSRMVLAAPATVQTESATLRFSIPFTEEHRPGPLIARE